MIRKLNLIAVMLVAGAAFNAAAAQTRKEARLEIAPGGAVNITDNYGSVILHPGSGKQVLVVSVLHSAKVETDETVTPDKKRVQIVAHPVADQKPTPEDARVDYEITVPAGVAVTVTTATAPITADGLGGDLNLSSDTGQITVRNVARVHVHVRGVAAPVNLANVNRGHVDVTSNGGPVEMVDVTGPEVSVGTTSGNISYRGDCSGAGAYHLTTHSGTIEMDLPATASFDVSARSVTGSVQNDFPLTQKTHTSFVPQAGRSFAGTSNSGSSSVELQSFSGRIRVKKQ